MKAVTAGQMRRIEKIAIEDFGIPALILMENAAARVSEACLRALEGRKSPKVTVIAGPGNNGGDGFAAARRLFVKNVETSVIFVGDIDAVRGDAAVNLEIARRLGIEITTLLTADSPLNIPLALESSDLVVDALFGTGLDRRLEGSYEYIVEMVNTYAKYVVAIDMPSGVNSDNGQIMGNAVWADETVMLGLPKIGGMAGAGAERAGKVSVADISIPQAAINQVEIDADIYMSGAEVRKLLPKRAARTNKGSFGRVALFAGCEEMPGAAVLAASAAYRAGAGLVCACAVPAVADVIHNAAVEVITRIVPEKNGMFFRKSLEAAAEELDKASVVVLGPGIGRGPLVSEFVADVLVNTKVPVIIDADALNAVVEDVSVLREIHSLCVITPHPGEMSRLTGLPIQDILADTMGVAGEFSRKHEIITLLKDARTVIASPSGHFCVNVTGNSALSKAGAGDVLAGMIAGFAAQGADLFTACAVAAYIHGKAGELAGKELTKYGVNASDLLRFIPKAIMETGI
ncbi:MAG: NAD(P)H-hydrate dehydratase [Defluviitaleaceae bacterium]|nr:NAD(P)H-hydrate dehydratase [Defluviitaleaceae bacterium]